MKKSKNPLLRKGGKGQTTVSYEWASKNSKGKDNDKYRQQETVLSMWKESGEFLLRMQSRNLA